MGSRLEGVVGGDLLEPLIEAQQTLGALAGRLVSALDRGAGAEGCDPTGTVRAVLDTDGRIREVGLASRWRREVGAGGLTAAVTSACAAAGEQFVAHVDEALAQQPSPSPSPRSRKAKDQSAAGGAWSLRDVAATVTELRDRIADMGRSGAVTDARVVGWDRGRQVEVRLIGGVVQQITLSSRWADEVSDSEVAAAVTAAIRDAYLRSDADGPRSVMAGRAYRDLSALLADPRQLAALFQPPAGKDHR